MMGNPVFVDTMNSLGGNGVAMGFDQLINALQTGVVDGAENNQPSYDSGQHYRYAKYYSLHRAPDHSGNPGVLEEDLEGLSKDDQALIMKLGEGSAGGSSASSGTSARRVSIEAMKEAGVEINEVADKKPFQDAVKPVWDKYGAKHDRADQAHPGGEVSRFVRQTRGPADSTRMRAGPFHVCIEGTGE